MSVDDSHGHNSEDEGAHEKAHEGGRNHCATVFFVLPSLARCSLNIALLAMHMWFWLEHTSNGGYDRFRCVLRRGRRARRGVDVVMRMRDELDIVVLCYCCILRHW